MEENELPEEESEPVEDTATEIPPEPEAAPPKEEQEFAHVEFTPAQQKRFNRLYAQVKQQEAIQNQLAEDNRKLVERLSQMETRTLEKESKTTLDSLKAARREAISTGDAERLEQIEDKIEEYKTAVQKAKDEIETTKKVEQEPLSTQLVSRIQEWAQETDDSGTVMRPFVHPNHPDHERFKLVTEFVLRDPSMSDKDEDEYFLAVDKALENFGMLKPKTQAKPKPTIASVLSSDTGGAGKSGTKLSPEQRKIARNMFRSSKDPEEEYRKAMLES